jgi:hypothetical protein
MKLRLFISGVLTTLLINVKAQTIPNAGFENWTWQSVWMEEPDSWTTNNEADTFNNSISVTKTSDSFIGNYAMQVINNWHLIEPGPLPGYAFINYTDTNLVTKISAYVKCDSISGTGKGIILIGGYLGGTYNSIASWETAIEIPQYTLIEIPLNPVMNYDSIQILIYAFASTNEMGVATGHVTLKVDEITEEIISDIKEPGLQQSLKISPNPFNEYATLIFENQTGENYSLTIYDTQGTLVETINNITTGKIKIERKYLLDGVYYFQVHSESSFIGVGKFILQKVN